MAVAKPEASSFVQFWLSFEPARKRTRTLWRDNMSHTYLRVLLFFLVAAVLTCGTTVGQEAKEKAVSGMMKMKLKKGLEMKGTPIDFDSIKVNTLFGEVDIPMHTIAGIRFGQEGNEQSTIVLLNGDAITGDITISDFNFVSDWGKATVNVSNLLSIVFRDDLAWSGINTPNGQRWRLTRVQPGQQAGRQVFGRPVNQ